MRRLLILPLLALALAAGPVAAQTIDRIKETKQLRIGFRKDAAPISFADGEGKPAGYTPLVCSDVAQSIANALNLDELDVLFMPVEASDRFDKVASGEIDLLCGVSTITLKRRAMVDFSIPTYVDGVSLMLPRGAEVGLKALAGKKVGVRADTTTEEALRNSLDHEEVDAEVVTFDDHRAGMAAMEAGEISAYFADQSILLNLFMSSKMPDKFMVSNEIMTIEKQGLAMARGDSDFRLMVDSILSEMFVTGEMLNIFQKAMPGVEPGAALKAMYLMSPIVP